MLTAVVITFILGYALIVFEHPLKLDKTVPALLMGAACWALISIGDLPTLDHHLEEAPLDSVLLHHIGKIAEILIFLIGAMTIVELIDLHKGFSVITNRINTSKKRHMLYIICGLGFFLSATLDNLASTIVLVSLLRKLVPDKTERIWFVCLAVISTNAGGAWSPIGDVTTTMLWIGKKVSAYGLVEHLVLPSIVCTLVPILLIQSSKHFRGNITRDSTDASGFMAQERLLSSKTMLLLGIGSLVFIPVFKAATGLPPYVGMMLSLGVVWLASEYIHPEEGFSAERKQFYSAHRALSRIEMSSILFFLGILVAVTSLESLGVLFSLAQYLDEVIPSQNLVIIFLGIASALIDNVPLVAATMGMYAQPMDSDLWHFIAYSAGTGGSMLIIGSAAGVAAMGMERIDFIWYLKNITWLAFAGFIAGALTFIAIVTWID